MLRTVAIAVLMVALLVAQTAAARPMRQVSGLELAEFPGREVLVIRTGGSVSAPTGFGRDAQAGKLTFTLQDVGADGVGAPRNGLKLIRSVALEDTGSAVRLTLTLVRPELADQRHFRISQPSEHVILIEVFPGDEDKQSAERLTDAQLEKVERAPESRSQPPAERPQQPALSAAFDPNRLGIPTVDLRGADPQRVLGLAASTGLLKLSGSSVVATERLGHVAVKSAGLSLASWSAQTPPGEMYLSGAPEQIAEFLRQADPSSIDRAPTLQQLLSADRPGATRPRSATIPSGRIDSASSGAGASAAAASGANQYRPDPYSGVGMRRMRSGQLSDVLVTLPATGGMNLYDVLSYLSVVSGISIIIDPYAFDDPMGNRPWREPIVPEDPPGQDGGPGFRPGSQFDPQFGLASGSVRGNFDNMPFDQALSLILGIHGLEFVVYAGDGRVGVNRVPSTVSPDSFVKPVVLVTSRERVQQELSGTNTVSMHQPHYADPGQLTEALDSLHMLPGTYGGWYVYQGTGGGGGIGGGQGGGFGGGRGGNGGPGGGGQGGGGQGGGGGGGLTGANLYTAKSGLLIWRGSDRGPIESRVEETVRDGKPVIRVLLAPESGQYRVTGLALP